MTFTSSLVALLMLLFVAQGASAQSPATVQKAATDDKRANPDALSLVDFKKRVDAYLKVHDEATKATAPVKKRDDPQAIKNVQDSLGARIRELRADAKQGDVFTPEIAAHFRRLLAPELKGEDGKDAKAVLKDDAPAAVPFKVNAKYPPKAPLPTVPANLLLALPTLPKALEYRIVNKYLILRDVDADIIVDFMPNAIR